MVPHTKSSWPAVVLTTALNIGCWEGCRAERAAVLAPSGPGGLPVLIAGLATVLVQLALVWLLLLSVLVALEPLAGRDLTSYAGCPPGLRRLVLACCGAAAAGMLAVPAHAAGISPGQVATGAPGWTDPVPAEPAPDDRPPSGDLDGLPLPDRTLGAPARRGPDGNHVVVRPGDTLWGIAAAHLPAGSSTGDVDRAWRVLYAGNRSLVGSDPDLIRPGMRLQIPPTPHQEDDR